MLIYVRESERQKIMSDLLTIDQQIPLPLQDYFQQEIKYRDQIESDEKVIQGNKIAYLMSEETVLNSMWDGDLISA
jgi:hypothetical protein